MARPLALMLAAVLGVTAAAPATAAPPRLEVYLGQVTAPDPQAQIGLQEWSQAFQQRIQIILYDAASSYYPGQPSRVVSVALPRSPDPAGLPQFWNDQQAIYIASAIASSQGGVTIIDSTVFLGAFKGSLPSPLLSLHQQVQRRDYVASQAALEAVTLFGLANQALAQGRPAAGCALFRDVQHRLARLNLQPMRLAALPVALRTDMARARCA